MNKIYYYDGKIIDIKNSNLNFKKKSNQCPFTKEKPYCVHRVGRDCQSNLIFHSCKHLFHDNPPLTANAWESIGKKVDLNFHFDSNQQVSKEYLSQANQTIQKAKYIVPYVGFYGNKRDTIDFIDSNNSFFSVVENDQILTHYLNNKLNKLKDLIFILRLFDFVKPNNQFSSTQFSFMEKIYKSLDKLIDLQIETKLISPKPKKNVRFNNVILKQIYEYANDELYLKKNKINRNINTILMRYASIKCNSNLNTEILQTLENELKKINQNYNLESHWNSQMESLKKEIEILNRINSINLNKIEIESHLNEAHITRSMINIIALALFFDDLNKIRESLQTQIDIRTNLIFKYEVYQLIIKPFVEFANQQHIKLQNSPINTMKINNQQ